MWKYFVFSTTLAATLAAAPAHFVIDSSHSSAQFTVRHLMISNVKGNFQKITGKAVWDPANLAGSSLEAVIDVTTINTLEPKRDAHLKSPDFFDVAKYPTMSFRSKKFYKEGGKLKIAGDLTIRGVTRAVVLDVDGPTPEIKDPWGGSRIGASASTTINRKDFGLTWNTALETGGVAVGDEVRIALDVELVKQQPAKTATE
jgi:polyisoprenoid-binding protein YceI